MGSVRRGYCKTNYLCKGGQLRIDYGIYSVADLNPGSGAFLTPGSGMGKKSGSGSGIRIRDEQPRANFRKLRNKFLG
jgi:hypothetical protein